MEWSFWNGPCDRSLQVTSIQASFLATSLLLSVWYCKIKNKTNLGFAPTKNSEANNHYIKFVEANGMKREVIKMVQNTIDENKEDKKKMIKQMHVSS